jgi:hypothetical protein
MGNIRPMFRGRIGSDFSFHLRRFPSELAW